VMTKLPSSVSLLSVIYRLCYDDQIIVQQGLDIYQEGTAGARRTQNKHTTGGSNTTIIEIISISNVIKVYSVIY
jgi:hypothetical protein